MRNALLVLTTALLVACSEPRGPEAWKGDPLETGEDESGVHWEIIAKGEGPGAKKGQGGRIHYRVLLEDGTVVDSTHDKKVKSILIGRDKHFIDGLHLGLIGMKKGELRRIYIPPHKGYQNRQMGEIPPNSTLIMEVELMDLSAG